MSSPEHALELYKLEYERCAIRYEDIYKAMWTNFSYLSVIAGAILTFGSTHLNANLAAFIACFPLLFWYWATYLPLDRYADGTLKTLQKIELTVNKEFRTNLDHYTSFLVSKEKSSQDTTKLYLRVRHVVKAFFFLLHIVAVLLSYKLYGLLVSTVLCVIIYFLYLFTHLGIKQSGVLKIAAKAIILFFLGAVTLLMLAKTPMPNREKKLKKITATNNNGVIDIKSDDKEDENIIIRLDGFDGITLK